MTLANVLKSCRVGLLLRVAGLMVLVCVACDEDSPTQPNRPAEDADYVSMARRQWSNASPPWYLHADSSGLWFARADDRWNTLWYNIEPDYGPHRRDLNPSLPDFANTLVTALDVEIDPSPPDTAWVGVMTGIHGGLDLTRRHSMEIWINDFKPDPADRGGLLRIDVGRIDEDFYEPNKNQWNDEDNNGNGWVAVIEDTGLDLVYNGDECAYPPCDHNVDYHGDDFTARRINGRFTGINGTEANGLWDTEDLDGSHALDQLNSYYSYVIDLANDTTVVDVRSKYPTYEGFGNIYHERDSWRLYRVDLGDCHIVAPFGVNPSLDKVTHIRVWFDDLDAVFQQEGTTLVRRFQIAALKFVN